MNKKRQLRQLLLLKKYSKKMRLAAENWKNSYETLIATILSARTRDEKTILIAKELFKKYSSVKSLSNANLSDVEKIIKPLNFYKNKSKNIINCAKEIIRKFNGKIPKDFDKLITLPGVGRKTANVFLSEYGIQAIGIDTHVSYASQELNWTKNKKPEKIEEDLKKLFPKNYWNKLNPILVRFGKTYTSKKEKDNILDIIKNIKWKKKR